MAVRAAAVIAVSAVVHGGLALVLAAIPLKRPLLRPAQAPEVTLEAPPPAPDFVAIEMIELPAPPAAPAAAPAAASASASGAAAISSAHPEPFDSGTRSGQAESKGGTEPGTRKLGMRASGEPPGLDLSLSGASDVLAEILSRPPRPEVPESGLLERNRNSKGGYKDTYTGHDLTFQAKIDADGHVSKIDDKANFHYKFHIPNPIRMARGFGEHVAAWAEDPYGVSTGTGSPTLPQRNSDKKEPEGRVFTILSGGFDVTDAIMRWAGQDPYNARKRAFLENTFDERVQIGTVHRAEQLEQADAIIVRHLDHLWAREDLELDEKRELVFELWDECAESGGEQLVTGGDKARAALLRWVEVHLPAGDDAAFSDDELERFNARRRSKARFAPY